VNNFRPSELSIVSKRDPDREGSYWPSCYFREVAGELQQMWWSENGEAVWESIPQGNMSLKDIALGSKQ